MSFCSVAIETPQMLIVNDATQHPQFKDYATEQGKRMVAAATLFDSLLATRPWMAGERFTIADITAFCGLEFARLVKFKPAEAGLKHLAAWRDRVAERPSAKP